MSTIGYKVVSELIDIDKSEYPFVLKLEIPNDAIIIKCTDNNTIPHTVYRTNKVIPIGFYTIYNIWISLNYSLYFDPSNYIENSFYYWDKEKIKEDIRPNPRIPKFVSRYSNRHTDKQLLYQLNQVTELNINELDKDESNKCSSGINYFESYKDAIIFLRAND